MARKAYYSHPQPVGVLGVYRTDPEVIGVYPELSSTVLPHAQEVRMRRGDDLDLGFQIQNDYDPPDAVLIDNAVVRWAAKQGYGVGERAGLFIGNEGALILKRSSDSAEISFSGNGRGQVHITREDSMGLPLSPALWDLEITMPVEDVSILTGSVQLMNTSSIVTAMGFVWPKTLKSGDIFEAQGRSVLVISRISDQHLKVDWTDWTTAIVPSSAPNCADEFSVHRGKTKTVASGPFVVEGDVVI